MDPEDFWPRFRNQYNDNEWAKLNREAEFRNALLAADEANISAIADKILIGDAQTRKEQRAFKDYYDKFGKNAT